MANVFSTEDAAERTQSKGGSVSIKRNVLNVVQQVSSQRGHRINTQLVLLGLVCEYVVHQGLDGAELEIASARSRRHLLHDLRKAHERQDTAHNSHNFLF